MVRSKQRSDVEQDEIDQCATDLCFLSLSSVNMLSDIYSTCKHGGIKNTISGGAYSYIASVPLFLDEIKSGSGRVLDKCSWPESHTLSMFYYYSRFLDLVLGHTPDSKVGTCICIMLDFETYIEKDSVINYTENVLNNSIIADAIVMCDLSSTSSLITARAYNIKGKSRGSLLATYLYEESVHVIIMAYRGHNINNVLSISLDSSVDLVRQISSLSTKPILSYAIPTTFNELSHSKSILLHTDCRLMLGVMMGKHSSTVCITAINTTSSLGELKIVVNYKSLINWYNYRVRTIRFNNNVCRDCYLVRKFCTIKHRMLDSTVNNAFSIGI